MNKEIANFFWHGELSKFETACIKSFIKNGFDVHLWSYNDLQVEGAISRDAKEIFPSDLLYKYKHHFNERSAEHSSLAAFSDAFRYKVLQHNSGWWFDTDCYCLRDQSEFYKIRENKNVVVGFEDWSTCTTNNAVLWCNNLVLDELNSRVDTITKSKNYELSFWGELGPTLLTKTLLDLSLHNQFFPAHMFYGITSNDRNMFTDPSKKPVGKTLIADSYLAHIWTSRWKNENIDKNNPPQNSLLKELIDFSYTNYFVADNTGSTYHYDRAMAISKLYASLLKRSPDMDGWTNYMTSKLDINEIKKCIMNSEEYIKINEGKHET